MKGPGETAMNLVSTRADTSRVVGSRPGNIIHIHD